ncbi:MAG TPA: mechanosensitive ion channel family protein [Acidimicrobiales bacterium]|nr:mechanosensitive ion channel family protein [Acidimicrobiales bacterium]
MLAQVDPQELAEACGPDPSFLCREVLERTDSVRTAELADVLFAKPLTIALILVVALVVNALARRAIGRFVGAITGEQRTSRRLKRRLRSTKVANVLPSAVLDTGQVSLRSAARAETLGLVLRSVASFAIWTIATITILGELGISLGPLIAGAGLAGVALGFGAQSLVKDFLAGIFILVEDQYGVGDIVDVGEASGTIEAVSLRTTRLRDVNGTVWHVPNGQIVRVGNKSQQWARALIDLAVAHATEIPEAERVIKQVADEVWSDPAWAGQVLEEPEVWGVERIGPEGVVIRLVVKTLPSRQFDVMRELRGRIKAALDEAGIDIPTSAPSIVVGESHTVTTVARKRPTKKAAAKKAAAKQAAVRKRS